MSLSEFDQPRQNTLLTVEMTGDNVPGLVEELGRFAAGSQFIVGITMKSNADKDGTAFTGGHTVEHREDYGTISVALDRPEGIRYATHLLISEERAAEIADAYVLPGHLKDPENHVDAYIGFIIKKLIGYREDETDSLAEQATASTDTLTTKPEFTDSQRLAFTLHGETNMANAHMNVLYRSQQVETMEHVLRFLIAREEAKPHMRGELNAGVDYEWATGILGEALKIVNGVNGFNEPYIDPESNDLLYRGLMPSKSSLAYRDGTVYFSGAEGVEPIWPPDKVEAYQAEQLARLAAAAEAEVERQRELAAQNEAWAAARVVAQAKEVARRDAELQETRQTMETLATDGYVWRGTMRVTPGTPMDSPQKIREYYVEKYGVAEEDVYIVEGVEIYAGKDPHISPGNVTVYTRQNKEPEA